MSNLNYYTSNKISEHVTRITSLTGEFLYLIEGKRKAVLVDTCLGVGHLKKYVEKLTDKPITVIVSHGHVDHAMGAPEFDNVYMNSADNDIYNEHKAMEIRKNYIQMGLSDRVAMLQADDFVPTTEANFHDLIDGMTFDLGEITLTVYEVPGHTPGSMVILINEEKTLILGDACNSFTFLFDDKALSVEEYKNSLQRLYNLTKGKFDKVYLSHGFATAHKDMLTSVIQVCEDIMAGRTDDIPFDFMGNRAYIAKAVNNDKQRLDGGLGNIVYDKEKVFAKKKKIV